MSYFRREWFRTMQLQQLLDEGKTVAVVNTAGTTIQRKHGHLTSITPVRYSSGGKMELVSPGISGKRASVMFIDELPTDEQ